MIMRARVLRRVVSADVTGAYAKKDMTATKEVILYIPLLVGAFLCCTGGKISELRFVSSASVTIVLTLCVWTTGEALFWYMPGVSLASDALY